VSVVNIQPTDIKSLAMCSSSNIYSLKINKFHTDTHSQSEYISFFSHFLFALALRLIINISIYLYTSVCIV